MNTIKIGSQVWATEDLKVTKFRNGEDIPFVEDSREWAEIDSAAYCTTPEGNYLYNWHAVNDARGLAPEGFSVPTDEEWTILTDGLGGQEVAGKQLKTDSWGGTNDSGFSALPGGYRHDYTGIFYNLGDYGFWWSSSPSWYNAWYRFLRSKNSGVYRDYDYVGCGFSVRCIKTQVK